MLTKRLISLMGTLGSVFVRRETDGKVAVAIGPWAVVAIGGLMIGCGTQDSEPFSQCVMTIGNYLLGA